MAFETVGVDYVINTADSLKDIRQLENEASKLDATVRGLDTSITMNVTADTATAKSDILTLGDLLDESRTIDVTADTTNAKSDLGLIEQLLQNLQTLAVIDVAIQLAASARDFVSNSPILQTIVDTDAAVALLNARTNRDIPNAAAVINDFYTNAWGGSREEIVNLLVEIERAQVAIDDIGAVGTAAFEAAAVAGEDPIEVFRRMDTLVKNNLVNSYGEASDAIVAFTNAGLNRGGDLLDTIDEYSQVANDAGLSLGAIFEILQAGTAAGARDTDKLIDSYKEMLNLTREEVQVNIATGDETDRTRALEELDLFDEAAAYAAGQLTGDQFSAGVLDGLRGVEDPAEQRRLALAIFSPTMVEDAGLPALLAADLEDSASLSQSWAGVAEDGAATINDTLSTSIEEVSRTLETSFVEALDNAFDLSGRLDTFKSQLTGFADALQAGLGFGEALEVSFGIEGASDFVTRFESSVGNMVIAVLELVAGIRDLQGLSSEGIRGEIARLSAQQLVFDLQAVTAEEMGGVLRTGIDRGVNEKQLQVALSTAVSEAIESGNLEQAEAIVEAADAINGLRIDMGGGLFEATVRTVSVGTAGLQEQIDAEVARQAIEVPVRPTFERTEDRDDFTDVTEDIASFTAGQAATAEDIANAAAAVAFAEAFVAAADATAAASSDTVGSMVGIEDAAIAMADTVTEEIQGNTVIDDFELMALSALYNSQTTVTAIGGVELAVQKAGDGIGTFANRTATEMMFMRQAVETNIDAAIEKADEFITELMRFELINVILNTTAASLSTLISLVGGVAAAASDIYGDQTNNVNTTINVQNSAQGRSAGQAIAATIIPGA